MNEQLKIIISAEIDKLKQGVQEAKGVVGTFKEEISKHKDSIGQVWNSVGEGATKASKAMIGGVAAVGTALVANVAATEEYRVAQAKLMTAFETAGASAEVAKGTYNDLYRVLGDGDVAVEAAGHLAQLTTNEQELSEWTNICQGVYATFGDSLPIEGLTEAANETAKVGSLTGSLADALNWAGVNEEAFQEKLDACNTESEREALIRETLNGIYSEAADNYEKTAADILAQNEAQAKLQESLSTLATAMAPVLTAFTAFATEALAVITPYIQELSEKYMPQFKETLTKAGEALKPIADFIMNHLPVIATIAGIILAIAAAYNVASAAMAAYTAIKTAWTAATGIATAAQAAFAAVNVAALAPILAVVAAITAVVAIIVVCIKHWDDISATVKKVMEAIKDAVKKGVDAVVNAFTQMKENVSKKVEEIKTNVVNKFNEVKSKISSILESAKTTALGIFDKIKSGITDKINAARDGVKNAIEKIKGFFNFEWSLPKIKLPHFSISGKFSLDPPSIPKFSVDWYQRGGVFDSATLFPWAGGIGGLGENGAEAIVPLEKNTQWLDKIADRLAQKQGSTPIVLEVDGKTFAQTSIDSINSLTRQRGKLGLNLV